ncbi:hypothetical protein J4W20_26380, partial [Escherichia coli]
MPEIARSCYFSQTSFDRSGFQMQTIGIVGTGAMGRGIAQIAAQAGLRVKLFDANPQAVEAARTALADTLAKLASKGKLT